MRLLLTYSLSALTFVAIAGAQIVLDPSPARVVGHPSTTPAEQLLVTNINPNLGVNGGMYAPQGVVIDTTGSTPILYVADAANNRVLAWQNATSGTLSNLKAPDLIIGQPNAYTTFPLSNGGLYNPTGLYVDPKGNLYIADSGNNRILRYPVPFVNPGNQSPDIVLGQPDKFTSRQGNQGGSPSAKTICLSSSCPSGSGPFIGAMAMDSAGNLFVADAGNNRILRFPSASLTAGALDPSADIVIGQTSFTLVQGPSSQLDKNVLGIPGGVAFDAEGHLFVTDSSNRMLVFPTSVSSASAGNSITAIRIAGVVNPRPATAAAMTIVSESTGPGRYWNWKIHHESIAVRSYV